MNKIYRKFLFQGLEIKIPIVIGSSFLFLIPIPLISIITGWEIVKNNDVENWATFFLSLPIAYNITGILYVILHDQNIVRKVFVGSSILKMILNIIIEIKEIRKYSQEEQIKMMSGPEFKSIKYSMDMLFQIYHSNADQFIDQGPHFTDISIIWAAIQTDETKSEWEHMLNQVKKIPERANLIKSDLEEYIGDDFINKVCGKDYQVGNII